MDSSRARALSVTLVLDGFVPSGLTFNLLRLVRGTTPSVRYRVLAADGGLLRDAYAGVCDVEVWGQPYHKWEPSEGFRQWVSDRLENAPPDVVHAHQIGPVTAVAEAWRGPFVCSWHSRLNRLVQDFQHRLVVRTSSRSACVIFAYGRLVLDDLIECGAPSDKIMVTWGGDIARIPPPVCCRNQDVVAAVGRLDPRKGFDTLVRAMIHLRIAQPNATLRIYGEGAQRAELEALIRECRLDGAVRLLGWRSDVWSEAAAAALLVSCSRSEGVPSVVLEAMSRDIPVLGSASVVPTIFPFDPYAVSCSAEDPVALARVIASRLAHPDRARQALLVGRRVRSSLRQAALSDQLVGVYREAAA